MQLRIRAATKLFHAKVATRVRVVRAHPKFKLLEQVREICPFSR
jgi:hypothetical protein